jgi:CRP-like cAMP-binding protein
MEALESVLAAVSIFELLRPDEIGRVAERFEIIPLARGESRRFEDPRLVVVVRGRVALEVTTRAGPLRSVLEPADRYGDTGLLTGTRKPAAYTALADTELAVLSASGLDALLSEFAAIALPLSRELSSELSAQTDVVRQLLELHAEQLPTDQRRAALEERRTAFGRRGARVRRSSGRALFARLVTERGAEPPFWMLAGFIVALSGARLVVAMIFKLGLEKKLFALVPGSGPNPMHVHHFNYGLILVGLAGIAALLPFGRRALRLLAFAFGAGAGLVFDEFALFWNLNPEYAQASSLIACAIAAAALIQLTYFRRLWSALVRRTWLAVRGAR